MVMVWIHVPEEGGYAVHIIDNYVNLAVVDDIAECRAAADTHMSQAGSFDGRH